MRASLARDLLASLTLLTSCLTAQSPAGQTEPPAVEAHAAEPSATEPLRIGGSVQLLPLLRGHASALQESFRLRDRTSGPRDGFDHLFAGNVDLCLSSRPIRPLEAHRFAEARIQFLEVPLAYECQVLMRRREDAWLARLSVEQLRAACVGGLATVHWIEIEAAWPELPVLFQLTAGTENRSDLLRACLAHHGSMRLARSYRRNADEIAGELAEHTGALAWLTLGEYRALQDPRLTAVSIDSGRGPVAPEIPSIHHGLYPISRPLFCYLRTDALDEAAESATSTGDRITRLLGALLRFDAQRFEARDLLPPAADAQRRIRTRFAERTAGSLFLSDRFEPLEGSLSRRLKASDPGARRAPR